MLTSYDDSTKSKETRIRQDWERRTNYEKWIFLIWIQFLQRIFKIES
jgi:hypothetical protein